MGNRLAALSLVLGLTATAALCADDGADTPDTLPAATGTGEASAPGGDGAGSADPAPEESSADASAAPDTDSLQAPGADLAAAPDAGGEAAPATGDLSANGMAVPSGDGIIAPIGDEVLDLPESDGTQLAGSFPAVDPSAPACREDTLLLRGDFGKARFSVKVADDGPERAQGLMHVKSMPPSFGMLFVYPSARPVSFWMKNTLIPLDMIFADQHGVVQRVHSMAKPRDLTQIPGGSNIQYVLEINGGMANMLGIRPGTQMRHPAIADAAWRCN